MAITVFKKPDWPWRQGDRTVETFRSGLVKVTDTYLAPTADIATAIGSFPVGGTVSGVTQSNTGASKIYPEPQTRDNGDGFSTISVTSYARTTADFTAEPGFESIIVDVTNIVDGIAVASTTEDILSVFYVCSYVMEFGTPSLPDLDDSRIEFIAYLIEGGQIDYSEYSAIPTYTPGNSSYFGSFIEMTTVIRFNVSKEARTTTAP